MPLSVSEGIAEKKASKAANPPADAPIPTTGNAATAPVDSSSSGMLGPSSGTPWAPFLIRNHDRLLRTDEQCRRSADPQTYPPPMVTHPYWMYCLPFGGQAKERTDIPFGFGSHIEIDPRLMRRVYGGH